MESAGQGLLSRLYTEYPHSSPRLTNFPTGSFVIELTVREEIYFAEYVVGRGYGLSKRRRKGSVTADTKFETVTELECGVRGLMTSAS